MARVGPGLHNVPRHGCGAAKSVQDFRASSAAVRRASDPVPRPTAHVCVAASGAGVSPRVVMDVLGHSQRPITMDLYSHVMPSALRDAADAMDRALNEGR
jgi:integrase